jgi:hypothetical protein
LVKRFSTEQGRIAAQHDAGALRHRMRTDGFLVGFHGMVDSTHAQLDAAAQILAHPASRHAARASAKPPSRSSGAGADDQHWREF